ncbi:succinyl-diaminopimelate desuccinylase [Mycena albidolilacea]|uniref:Succinyl-diaminopimelate desuccinylase n=1 Tax=Mycena albidolilacea TaxID=1033008 RepID=A0AAD7EQ53_9AGAR|nr:succinyl-diaminopimelate desuccinylase [Mycena albidolilacea]
MFIDSGKLSLSQLAAIQQASKDVLEDATHFLTQLIKIDTTNPPGRNYHEIAVLIKDHLRSLQYDANLLKVASEDLPILAPHDTDLHERVNVLGRLKSKSNSPNLVTVDGKTREKTLNFNGHTDVVPAGDLSTWTHPPFGAEIVEGVIYGRGVSDMKGGLAAGIWAVEAVRRAGLVLKGTVEQSAVVDEETTGNRNAGAGWLVEHGHVSPETCDAVVITEPLNVENVCLGHRGAIWGTVTFSGRASHGATPQRGINALVHAATFILRANEKIGVYLAEKRDPRVIPEEAQGASLTFTVLEAGSNTNSVPDLATLRFDRRLVPSESLDEARSQILSVLDELAKEIPELSYKYTENYSTEPVWVDEELEVCKIWRGAVETVLKRPAGIVCSPGSDDQRFFVRGGIPQTIVYGPGNIRNIHNKDEGLDLEDFRKSIEVMAIGVAEFLGVD